MRAVGAMTWEPIPVLPPPECTSKVSDPRECISELETAGNTAAESAAGNSVHYQCHPPLVLLNRLCVLLSPSLFAVYTVIIPYQRGVASSNHFIWPIKVLAGSS